MSFHLSQKIDSQKIFVLKKSELEGRLDPFCYIPELVELDKLIKSKTSYCLKDFVIFRASGATPGKSKSDNYSDKVNGVPLVRVQNLSVTGELQQNDFVYISKSVHEGELKRSQLKPYDLLIKITGVGRMAVASVVPENFEGNINQHIVVARTGSKEISENIAAYLNLDIIEKLATKRATGGTRPALDYTALFSIPVVNAPSIYRCTNKAVLEKKQKEKEAQELLNSIDGYFLAELGLVLSQKKEDSLEKRTFVRRFKDTTGVRMDPNYHFNIDKILGQKAKYSFFSLRDLIVGSAQYGANESAADGDRTQDTRYIRITDIDELGNLKNSSWRTAEQIEERYLLNENDLLFARSGSVGRAYIHKNTQEKAIFAGYLIRFVIDSCKADPDYIFYYCHSKLYKLWVNAIFRPAVQANINAEEYKSLPVVLPPLQKQIEISRGIKKIRDEAMAIQREAYLELEQAKQEVEAMILGEA